MLSLLEEEALVSLPFPRLSLLSLACSIEMDKMNFQFHSSHCLGNWKFSAHSLQTLYCFVLRLRVNARSVIG